jgi:hypothetical protein
MATRLKNIVHFLAVPPGVPTPLPHLLNVEGRAVVPDNVVPQVGGFTVTANGLVVTVVNNGAAAADLDVLVEHWHTVERAFGVAGTGDNTALSPQPFVVEQGGSGSFATISPGTGVRQVIYVRPTGNDATGDGSLLLPYLTPERGLRDVPNIIQAPDRYVIEMTGYGTYSALADIIIPPIYNTQTLLPFTIPPYPFTAPDFAAFPGELPLTFQAVPTTTPIAPADIVSQTSIGGGAVRMVTNLALVPGALIGQFLITDTGFGVQVVGTIYDNDATDIFYAGSTAPVPTDFVSLPTATIQTSGLIIAGVRCPIQFNGIGLDAPLNIRSSIAPRFAFLNMAASQNAIGGNDDILAMSPAYLDNSSMLFTERNHFIFGGVANSGQFQNQIGSEGVIAISGVCLDTAILTTADDTGFTPAASSFACFVLNFLAWRANGFISGFVSRGEGIHQLLNLYMTGGAAGDAAVRAFGGRIFMRNVKGTGSAFGTWTGGFGVLVPTDGQDAQITVDGTTDIPGSVSDLKIGSLAGRTWAAFRGIAPINQQADVGAAAGQTQSVVRQP